MKKYCLAVDLVDHPQSIEKYEFWHQPENIPDEIKKSIKKSGIIHMDIFRVGNRLVMIMETEDNFSFEQKARMDGENSKVQDWEKRMWEFQQPLPWARQGEKWMLMEKIFALSINNG